MPEVSQSRTRIGTENDFRRSIPMLREPRYSQSLERGLAILRCFGTDQPVLGISEIADELGMSRSTTHRYVITLVALGYLEQEEAPSRKYRLGLGVTDLGMSVLNATGLREQARPVLEGLRRETSYTTSIAVLDGADVLCVERVRGFRRGQSKIDFGLGPGSRSPAYCTALGKVLLAFLPEHELRNRVAEMRLSKRVMNTIASKKSLREELRHVREEGLAVDDQELVVGMYSIAVPVRAQSGEVVAAVDLAAHSSMISLRALVAELGPHLISAAGRISARLGYRRDDEVGRAIG